MLFQNRAATCRRPQVKGLTLMSNSTFNGWRMEDVWLDRWYPLPSCAARR